MTTSTKSSAPTATKAEEKTYQDLEKRTLQFAKDVRTFIRKTPRTIASLGDCRQLIKSSGAIGSAYTDSQTTAGYQGTLFKLYDCRQEARQSQYWLELIAENLEEPVQKVHGKLVKEADELTRIFGSIVSKMQKKKEAK